MTHSEDSIRLLLLKLLSFDTQNNDEVEKDRALKGETLPLLEFVRDRLSKIASVDLQEYSINCGTPKDGSLTLCNRGNLVARLNDPEHLPRVLLQGHVDTVPFGNFQGNPLGEVKEGIIYGRGAADMKGPVSAMITAFEKIAQMNDRMYSPVLLLTSDEEARDFAGIKKFLEANRMKIDFGICGEPTDFKICNRFKGATSRTIEVSGKAAHGSRPHEGRNAIYDAARIVILLQEFSEYINENLINPAFGGEDDNNKRSTLNVGRNIGGNKVNTVPESSIIEYEMRLVLPIEQYESELKSRVLDRIPPDITYAPATGFIFGPMVIDVNDAFSERLNAAIKLKGKSLEFSVMDGFSEASLLNINGIKTIIFGSGKSNYCHSSDEQIKVEDLELYEQVLISFFGSKKTLANI